MENNQINNSYVPLADEAFLSLGAQQIAYVKAINLPDGAHAFGIYSADGKPMAMAAKGGAEMACCADMKMDNCPMMSGQMKHDK